MGQTMRYSEQKGHKPLSVPAILTAIKGVESGNYKAPPNSAHASGAYQIIPGTWKGNGGGQYATEAYLATPAQQDAIATKMVNAYMGGPPATVDDIPDKIARVAVSWYMGPGSIPKTDAGWQKVPSPEYGNKLSPYQYAEHLLSKYGAYDSNGAWFVWTFNNSSKSGKGDGSIGVGDLPGIAGDVITHPGDAVDAAGNLIGDAIGNPLAGIDAIGAFFSLLSQWDTWQRILQIAGGLLLLIGGTLVLNKDLVASVAKVAAV